MGSIFFSQLIDYIDEFYIGVVELDDMWTNLKCLLRICVNKTE